MKGSIGSDIFGIVISSTALFMFSKPEFLDITAKILIYSAIFSILLINIFNIILRLLIKNKDLFQKLNIFAMFSTLSLIAGLYFGRYLINNGPWSDYSFGFYILISFVTIISLLNSSSKVENPLVEFITIPILIVGLTAQFLVFLIDLFFPPKVQELVPYIDALRTLVLNIANIMADPQRLAAESALEKIGNMSEAVSDIGEGYALRKGLGQGIDFGLTAIVIALGAFSFLIRHGVSPTIAILLFGSLGLALATFSGLFGPFYGIAETSKNFSLHHGNYRGASFFKTVEEIFAIPFMAASAGFLLLDLPPVDAQTLDEFKNDMQEQIKDISDNINSLLGKNASAVPRKTRKMIESLMDDTTKSLSKLDFRNVREETAREFALTYYQHEFSFRPWKRKKAVKEFAKKHHFDFETAEQTLKLIGYKIDAGQMDDDMVSNVMISAAMRGVIMMEQKYQSMLDSVELGQTCTGLAFGARQFLKDHYVVRSRNEKFAALIKNFLLGVFTIPIVLIIAFHNYANRMFDVLGDAITDQEIVSNAKMRYQEIRTNLLAIPDKIKASKAKKITKEEKEEKRKQKSWELKRKIKIAFSKLLEVLVFPFKLIIGSVRWIIRRFTKKETNPRQAFEEAVAHAALVEMYNELYNKLVVQDYVSSTY